MKCHSATTGRLVAKCAEKCKEDTIGHGDTGDWWSKDEYGPSSFGL
jgi:hypothetical protein